jgi:glucosamine-6-phosphate deaminase
MECIIRPDAETAAHLVARLIDQALRANPKLVLGLATGRTMESLYRILVRMHLEEGLDFSQCQTFNLDEYVGLPAGDPHSYRHYMKQHLFDQVNLDPRNTHLPDGAAPDPDAEGRRYDALIADAGGIDLQLLGIGQSGHIGFNEPLSALRSRTRVKALSPATLVQNAPLFPDPAQMPRRAITMGVGTILDCRRCVLLATGKEKAAIIAKAIEGPITAMVSATALQLHERCTVVVDEAAAGELKESDYYRWIFQNEPEWQIFQ